MAGFGKKPKGQDFNLLRDILNRGADTQAGLIKGGFTTTGELGEKFRTERDALGRTFETGANQRAEQFAQGLQQVESPNLVREQQAKARELAFRGLPGTQELIRENLAATGGLNRGAAVRALQQPVLQASQQASDTGFQIQQEANLRNIQRKQIALDTIFNTGQGAALERLGIDRETANVLLETGRSDILDRAFKLAGIEEGRTQGLLNIEQSRQISDIAREQAKRADQAALVKTLTSTAGSIIGSKIGGPIGGAIGKQGGGTVANLGSSLIAGNRSAGAQSGGQDINTLLLMQRLFSQQQSGGGGGRGAINPSGIQRTSNLINRRF
jgi:hypothetical protein